MRDTALVDATNTTAVDRYEDEVDLTEYLTALWERRWMILTVPVLVGLMAFGFGTRSAKVYEASVKLLVSPPKTALPGELAPAVSVATFRALVENQSLAATIVREFKLDAPPLRMTPHSFLTGALGVETLRDSNVVVLKIRLASRDLPAKVANRLAELVVELSERLNQDETIRTRDGIKVQLDFSRARLEAAEKEVSGFKQQAQIEALRKDVEAELTQRGRLLALLVEIQRERARLSKAEEELARRSPIGTVRRTIDNDAGLMEAAKERIGPGASVLGLEFKNEYLSEVYEAIDQEVAQGRAKLSGLEKERAELIDVRKLNSDQLSRLNVLYSRESRLEQLETEYDLAKKIYLDVATRYEQVRLQVAGRSAQLQLLDAALPSDRPVGPRVLRNTAAVTLLAFVGTALAAMLMKVLGGLRLPSKADAAENKGQDVGV